MIRKYVLPIVATAGTLFAVSVVVRGSQPVPEASPIANPPQSPFAFYIAGAGIVEAVGQNVAIGSPLSRLVLEVHAKVGDRVKKNDPLFKLDDRDLAAELIVRESALASARAKLQRLLDAPRPEEIPPAEARVAQSDATLADLTAQLAMAESVQDKRAVSQEELSRRRFAVQNARARLAEARAQLDLLKAGSWKPDVEVARADVSASEAQVHAARTELERAMVRAPADGGILQVNVRAGEFAPTGALVVPLMVFGRLHLLNIRVDVDENDAWRFRKSGHAVAYVRGNRELKTSLTFDRVEPYVIPKRSLTGDTSERVDTRVLQVVYSFDPSSLPVFVGQQMDVFIEAADRVGGIK